MFITSVVFLLQALFRGTKPSSVCGQYTTLRIFPLDCPSSQSEEPNVEYLSARQYLYLPFLLRAKHSFQSSHHQWQIEAAWRWSRVKFLNPVVMQKSFWGKSFRAFPMKRSCYFKHIWYLYFKHEIIYHHEKEREREDGGRERGREREREGELLLDWLNMSFFLFFSLFVFEVEISQI